MPLDGPLYVHTPPESSVPGGLPLVIALTGFTDAGSAVSQLIDVLRQGTGSTPLIAFSNDVLLDYRARRPIVSFDEDHLHDYRPPRLELTLATDALGQRFLALTGYEPDFAWEAFAEAVLGLSRAYQVSSVTWVHAIAMPVPHTRPLGTTVSGNREELIDAHSVWRPHTEVPATIGHLLEMRFAAEGVPVSSFVLLVPHYLADTTYPGAAIRALESVALSTGIALHSDDLHEQNRAFVARVEEQIAGNEELGRMLAGLEERYDQYMAGSLARNAFRDETEWELPSADELAAELERFLANQPRSEDER